MAATHGVTQPRYPRILLLNGARPSNFRVLQAQAKELVPGRITTVSSMASLRLAVEFSSTSTLFSCEATSVPSKNAALSSVNPRSLCKEHVSEVRASSHQKRLPGRNVLVAKSSVFGRKLQINSKSLLQEPSQGSRFHRKEGTSSIRAASSAVRTGTELKEGIAEFYDASSGLWEDMWGEHMHHGYYPPGKKVDNKEAQIDMIENTLAWAGIPTDEDNKPKTIVDVGCGIGGSARHLSRKYGASVKAITLSPVQAKRGNAICQAQGLADKVELKVADALHQPFADNSFDLVWSMESGEHMPDKKQFVGELARVAAPGGRIIVVTWCHRNLKPDETKLAPDEQALLDKICDAYYLPAWCSTNDYVQLANEAGLQDVRSDDWSEYITPFWPAVVASALSLKGLLGLLRTGWTTIKGAIAMTYMIQGFRMGVIKFAIITARKPTS